MKSKAKMLVDNYLYESVTRQGQGVGNDRQGTGGTDICKCPNCGTTVTHERGIPCSDVVCPNCGHKMVGEGLKSEAVYLTPNEIPAVARACELALKVEPNSKYSSIWKRLAKVLPNSASFRPM